MIIRLLYLVLFAAIVHAALRFVRGLRNGLDPRSMPRRSRRRSLDIDESEIIEAEYTDITEQSGPPKR